MMMVMMTKIMGEDGTNASGRPKGNWLTRDVAMTSMVLAIHRLFLGHFGDGDITLHMLTACLAAAASALILLLLAAACCFELAAH